MKRALLLAGALMLSACTQAGVAQRPAAQSEHRLTPLDLGAFFDCLRERGHTIAAAHRGGPAPGFAENAIPTFAHTLSQAPVMLEIDISRTRDGALVLMHDDTLDRTTNGEGLVRERTLAEVRALRLEGEAGRPLDARPPTLREALDWARGRTVLQLDVKQGVSYEDVVAEVRAADAMRRVVFITYSDDAAVRVHNLAPDMMLSVSIDELSDLDALAARGVDLSRVLAWTGIDEPNPALNAALTQAGVEPMFGTLGPPERSWDGRFARDGRDQYAAFADTGLTVIATDRPIEASRDLDAHDGVEGVAAQQCLGAG
jgi:glycerophosphoryl diester phosphodiesterase